MTNNEEKVVDVDNSSREEPVVEDIEKTTSKQAPATVAAERRGLQPPELIRNWTAEERAEKERLLRKKIDIRLLPMIILMYILNYIDRNNIAAARLAGLERDLNMDPKSNQFQVSNSLSYG
jgi:hypothetical protein